jgi:hypothetical protein
MLPVLGVPGTMIESVSPDPYGDRVMRRFTAALVLLAIAAVAQADDWPQWLGPQRDGVWRESGIVERLPTGGPKVVWRTPIGMGYAGPAVAGGRVYVTDRALATDAKNPASAFDRKSTVAGNERVVCLDEATGKVIWQHTYDCPYRVSYAAGPRTTPVIQGGKLWTLGTMGDLLCLDIGSGKVLWSKNLPKEYQADVPVWGYSASLLLDGDKIISLAGGKDSIAVALHKDTGKELWRALSAKEIGYCPPVIFEAGGKRQLIIWHSDAVNGLDPETGQVYWSVPFAVKVGMAIPQPRKDGDHLFVSCFYNGPMMLKLDADKPAATVLWKGKSNREQPSLTDGLHCVMSTPWLQGDYLYGVCSYGQMRCLKSATGERQWESLAATGGKLERWGNAFIVPQGDRFFLFNEHGDLIIARFSPKGYEEVSRAHVIEPTNTMAGRPVDWVMPAFANKSMIVRNDKEIIRVSLGVD